MLKPPMQKRAAKIRDDYPEMKDWFAEAEEVLNTLKKMAEECEKLNGDKKR